jgi:hypothetical protein
MAEYNARDRTLKLKIVYYGPAVGGKTTNIKLLHRFAREARRGEMISLNSLQDRTILFDMMPLQLGGRGGVDVKLQLLAVPGQAVYSATRKIALKGVDGVVFVANSASDRFYDNSSSFEEMRRYLLDGGANPDRIPMIVQYNKRDLPEVSEIAALDRALNARQESAYPAVAVRGEGVLETFRAILERTMADAVERFPHTDLTRGATPACWVRETLKTVFGRESLSLAGDDTPEQKPVVAIRVAAGESGQTDPISITEAYADACTKLGTELGEVRAVAARAETDLSALRRAIHLAGCVTPDDLTGTVRALLSSLGETAGAAHASLALLDDVGIRPISLPPLERDPVLADPAGRAWAAGLQDLGGAELRIASEDERLSGCLAWAGPTVSSVVVVPIRSRGRTLGLALLHLLEEDEQPDTAALVRLDDLAAVFAVPLERASGVPVRYPMGLAPEVDAAPLTSGRSRKARPVFEAPQFLASHVTH